MQHRSEPRTGRHCLEDQTADSGFLESAEVGSGFLESAEVGSHTLSGPSCPEGSRMSPQDERLLLNDETRDSWPPEEMNSIRGRRLDRSELLCNKVLLKYKGDRESL